MKNNSSQAGIVLFFFLIAAFFLWLLVFNPLPTVTVSWKKIFRKTGLEDQEDARRELIAQRKKASAQKIKENFEALKNQQELLREQWKINEEQRVRAIEQTQIQKDRQQDLKSFTDEQMRRMRDKIQDRANGL